MNITRYRTFAGATAFAAVAALGLSSQASAGAIAYADLLISNFTITAVGPAPTVIDAVNNGSTNASLTGFAPVSSGLVLGAGPIDPPLSCVGNCAGIGENNFNQTAFPGAANHFSRGDSNLALGVPAGDVIVNATNADVVAETSVQVLGGSDGDGQGNIGNTAEFRIEVGDVTTFNFNFTADRRIFAHVDGPPETTFGNAFATTNYAITVDDDAGNVFSWSPNGSVDAPGEVDPFSLNRQTSRSSAGTNVFDQTGVFSNTVTLDPGTYFFTIAQSARTTARAEVTTVPVPVPEPSTLALLGFGLLGAGFLLYGRRRNGQLAA